MHVFGECNGIKFRVNCDRTPTTETMNAINKMVEILSKNPHGQRKEVKQPLHSSGPKRG